MSRRCRRPSPLASAMESWTSPTTREEGCSCRSEVLGNAPGRGWARADQTKVVTCAKASRTASREVHQRRRGVQHPAGARSEKPVRGQALLATGFTYRTTILWHDDQAGSGTDRGTPDPSAPHVIPPVEAIIVVHRGSWKRILDEPRPHDLGHDDWLQLCGPRGLMAIRVT